MKIATWNVNGVRARQAQVLEWLERERPDVACLQEIKASVDQLGFELRAMPGYWSHWHGGKGYSGVALLVRRDLALDGAPPIFHPPFDFEHRICTATIATPAGDVTFASVYVPNGGKDYAAKLRFLEGLQSLAAEARATKTSLVLCGDLNVARSDMDIHEKERKPGQIGARDDERAIFERMLGHGLVDIARAREPTNDALFTWWAPWRERRKRNIGWRIDYVLASEHLAARSTGLVVQRETGDSDHGPVVATFDL